MNIAEVLRSMAGIRGNRPALIDRNGHTLSYQELESATATAAATIAHAGISQGDPVLLLHPVSIELYVFLIALFRLGAVAVFLDPSAGREHIERCCTIFPPKAFFGSRRAQLLRLWNPALRRIGKAFCSAPFPGATLVRPQTTGPRLDRIVPADANTPALVTFTSGSTGQPKAALRSHGFLIAQHHALEATLGLKTGNSDLTTLPVFVLANLASGVTSVLPNADMRSPGAIDPKPVISQIERHGVITTAASPAFIARLAGCFAQSGKPITQLKRVFIGGAPVFPDDLRRARAAFPEAEITAVYGSTEAEPMAEVSLADISDADFLKMENGGGLLAGKPVASIALKIVRDQWGEPIDPLSTHDFASRCLPVGEIGEIVVSGPHVLSGYLGGAGDLETKFDVDGVRWHRTGDLGHLDQRGRLWLMGRASAKITDSRGVLYPFAVECAARQVPGVRRAALTRCSGQRTLAVELDDTSAESALTRNLSWAQLDEVRVVPKIPFDKRHNAKVDYTALGQMLMKR